MRNKSRNLVVGYIRVSSIDQVREAASLPRQEAQIRAYCELKGLPNPTIISDAGVSGFKETRQGFQKLVAMCKAGQVRTVVVYDLSRLSRSVRTTLEFIEDQIQMNDISFVSLMQDIDTTTPSGKAFLTLTSVFNQLYRDEIAFKTKTALSHMKQKNQVYSGRIPFGFDADVEGRLTPSPTEQRILARILTLRTSGLSYRKIATVLELKGITTKLGSSKWSARFIKTIIDRSVLDGHQK